MNESQNLERKNSENNVLLSLAKTKSNEVPDSQELTPKI